MINESARLLREVKEMKQKLSFKYIIVDEYQDISRQRFDLTKALSEVTDAKIIAVGDDWQSIYAFSGSDITLILFRKIQNRSGNVYYLRKISQIQLLFIHMIARPKAEKEIEEVVPIMQLHMP